MADIPLFPSKYDRVVAKEAELFLKNRFAERNPSLSEDPVAVISRPALLKFAEAGTGHVRATFDQPGTFNDDLFVVSGLFLYRVATDGTVTTIGQVGTSDTGSVSMAATAPIGDTVPAYLFLCDGGVLWVYTENGSALGTLNFTAAVTNGDTVVIDSVYYQFTTGSVDAGTPAGTVGNPWLVNATGTLSEEIQNLANAIDSQGVPGTDYSTALTEHPTVQTGNYTSTDLFVIAKTPGVAGNSLATTETGANMSWGAATLEDGGDPQLRQIRMPEDYGAISLADINSYVIVVPVQEQNIKGRFYWIEPGEVVVDPLNFATAERSPDELHQVVVFGDMFWLCGQKTTEPWVTTGDSTAPMQRFKGILFDRGSWPGTAIQIKDSLYIIDEDGALFEIRNGLRRVTEGRPDIEEFIRRGIQSESQTLVP